jgi:histidyl-tRNA synthetase
MQPVRGTRDIYNQQALALKTIETLFFETTDCYGYTPIYLPLFESTEVFARTLGETSDVVSKEMYTFTDRSDNSLTLRPEGTASVVRALISNGLQQDLPKKFVYTGPMFRYERPQKGRYRQFYQGGAEYFGILSPVADAEIISMARAFLEKCGIEDAVLHLNTLGDKESRQAYTDALLAYLTPLKDKLSKTSQERLDKNPLRILDSKDKDDQAILKDAPIFADHLTPEATAYFEEVCNYLTTLHIPFEHNKTIVRGLDYYNHTVFEFRIPDMGAQDTVLAGGRYDHLIEQMGGKSIPAVGWATGFDRILNQVEETVIPDQRLPAAILTSCPEATALGLAMAENLRDMTMIVHHITEGNLKKQLKQANKIGAYYAVIMGEDEIDGEYATIKDLESGEQLIKPLDQVIEFLSQNMPIFLSDDEEDDDNAQLFADLQKLIQSKIDS